MKSQKIVALFPIAGLIFLSFSCQQQKTDGGQAVQYGTFAFEKELTLPGAPELIYDALTGDISGWWDHSFSGKPFRFYIEPRPGGGFYEIFNESDDGVLHATVTWAERGKRLRFDGPLGLAGKAIQLVCTFDFEAAGSDSTRLTLSAHAAGEMEKGLGDIVSQVWDHFLLERFKPYVEAGKHLTR